MTWFKLTAFVFGLIIFAKSSSNAHDINSHFYKTKLHASGLLSRRSQLARQAVARSAGCPKGCAVHGVCNEELGRCDCPRHYGGPACTSPVSDLSKICATYSLNFQGKCRTDEHCFNGCSERGQCVNGICHCEPGFWGMDCSISWGPDGKPQLLEGRYRPRKSGVKIYVYELPPNVTSWFSLPRMDRPIHLLFWQRLMSSGMRTLDGNEADYYFLPINTRGVTLSSEHLKWSLSYIRETWPWWSQDNGHRHLVIHCGDMGVNDFPETLKVELGDAFANITWLSHWGLYEAHPVTGWPKAHRPGKDIVIPAIIPTRGFHESPLNPANMVKATAEGKDLQQRNGTLFFAGTICGDHNTHPNEKTGECSSFHQDYSLGVRQAVFYHHHKRKDFKLVVRSSTYLQDIASHRFCLAPVGGGYGKRQLQSVLMGCVPVLISDFVMQPFQPEMDWARFSVSVPEKDIPHLHRILKGISKETHNTMQKRLYCAAQHLFYSSSLGAIMGEDGRYDAFETLVEILRVRRDHPDVSPEKYVQVDEHFRKFVNCELDGPDPLPLCTAGKERQFPERPSCVECEHGHGGEDTFLFTSGGMLCCSDHDLGRCPRAWV